MRINNKLAVAAAVTGIVALGAGTAVAYWTTSGSGTGDGSIIAGESAAVVVSDNFAALGDMFPGDEEQTLIVKAKNNAAQASYLVTDVSAWITTDKAGCDGDDFLLNGVAAPSAQAGAVSLNWVDDELVAGGTSAGNNQSIQFNNKADAAQNACQGAAVTIHYIAS